jgi:hypothetical protein
MYVARVVREVGTGEDDPVRISCWLTSATYSIGYIDTSGTTNALTLIGFDLPTIYNDH